LYGQTIGSPEALLIESLRPKKMSYTDDGQTDKRSFMDVHMTPYYLIKVLTPQSFILPFAKKDILKKSNLSLFDTAFSD
jgi:hypothetical protein